MIFALSIHSFVDKIGAYAGFAAAIGVALLALLLFAQARELRRLREWGAHAHDRIGELERRLAAALELARRAGASQRTMAPGAQRPGAPAATASGRPAATPPGAGGRTPAPARTTAPTRLPLLPVAPAGVAGAALGSATVLLPLPKHPPGAAQAPAVAGGPATAPETGPPPSTSPSPTRPPAAIPAAAASAAAPAAAAGAPPPATAAAQGPAQPPAAAPPGQPAPVSAEPPAPGPAGQPAPVSAPTVAPAATNGHSDTFPPVPPVRPAGAPARSGARPPGPGARPGAGRRAPGRGPARPTGRAAGAGARPAAPLRARSAPSATPRGTDASHGRRRLLLLLGALGVVAIAAIAIVLLSGSGSSSTPSASSSGAPAQRTAAGSRQAPVGAAPAHDKITVAVLNGTATPGLANTVATTLASAGFLRGPVGNASDQQRSVTVVSYFGGHEREAREVAKTLSVPSDAVQPIDRDTEAACAQGASCTATVVVTVGADRR